MIYVLYELLVAREYYLPHKTNTALMAGCTKRVKQIELTYLIAGAEKSAVMIWKYERIICTKCYRCRVTGPAVVGTRQ